MAHLSDTLPPHSLAMDGYSGGFFSIQPIGSYARYLLALHDADGKTLATLLIDEERGFDLWEYLGKTMGFFESVELASYQTLTDPAGPDIPKT